MHVDIGLLPYSEYDELTRAAEYLTNKWADLVTNLQNLPLIIDNLCQHKVFGVHQLDALKAEKTDFDKARFILGFVITQGDEASYELLRILDVTRKRTLHQDLHIWISYFPFGEEVETSYSVGECLDDKEKYE
uniref:CARD domain-containing protein n=1 Tax=Pygocentrus nattereri TaxID=42514 RepID=A0AAR2IL86_PYGNA